MLQGAQRRLIREHNDRAWLAHQTAALVQIALNHPKKFPKLERLLHSAPRRGQRQTPEQMLGIIKMLNAAFGGRVIDSKAKH